MRLCRDPAGVFFFLLCHIVIVSHFLFVYYTTDDVEKSHESLSNIQFTSYLIFHKVIFYILMTLTFLSQLKASFTDPGKITINNNVRMLEYYMLLYENSVLQAQQFTKERGQNTLAKIITQMNIEDGYAEEESDYDDYQYEPLTSVPDAMMSQISEKYKVRLRRCNQCYIVRPNRVHHCPICRGCILGMDHHCPWINNCVGQFNRKFFFLFDLYSLLGGIESLFICVYYTIFKNYQTLFDEKITIWLVVIQIILCLLFGIFAVVMLKDLYDSLENNSTYIDYVNLKVLEKRTFWEEVYEMFGGDFSIGWFLPFKIGGYKSVYNKIPIKRCVENK